MRTLDRTAEIKVIVDSGMSDIYISLFTIVLLEMFPMNVFVLFAHKIVIIGNIYGRV